MTEVFDRLEPSDLVQRIANVEGRRVIKVYLTLLGQGFTQKIQKRAVEENQRYTGHLSEQGLKR